MTDILAALSGTRPITLTEIIGAAAVILLFLIWRELLGIRYHVAHIEKRGRPNNSYFVPSFTLDDEDETSKQ